MYLYETLANALCKFSCGQKIWGERRHSKHTTVTGSWGLIGRLRKMLEHWPEGHKTFRWESLTWAGQQSETPGGLRRPCMSSKKGKRRAGGSRVLQVWAEENWGNIRPWVLIHTVIKWRALNYASIFSFLDSLSLSPHLSASGCQDPSLVTHIAFQDFDIPSPQELHAAPPLPGKVRRAFSLLPSLALILSWSPFSPRVIRLLPVTNPPRLWGSEGTVIVSQSCDQTGTNGVAPPGGLSCSCSQAVSGGGGVTPSRHRLGHPRWRLHTMSGGPPEVAGEWLDSSLLPPSSPHALMHHTASLHGYLGLPRSVGASE